MGSLHNISATYQPKRMMQAIVYACLLTGAFTLPGCASPSRTKIESTVARAAPTAVDSGELSAEFVYKYLIAEVAGQRGDFANEAQATVAVPLRKSAPTGNNSSRYFSTNTFPSTSVVNTGAFTILSLPRSSVRARTDWKLATTPTATPRTTPS